MDKLTQTDLQQLMEKRNPHCVTIYAPMVMDEPQNYDKNRIYFKNGLSKVREELTGMAPTELDRFLEPLDRLLTDEVFWGNQSHGLAAFLTDGLVKTYRLPLEFEPTVYVASRFYIKPLLPYFENSQLFHILSMSQNSVRLFTGSRYGIEQVSLQNVPTSMDEALAYDDPEKEQQGHTAAARQGRGDNTDVIYHGHSPQDEHMSNLQRFAWQVRNGLATNLVDTDAPIVLAGTPDTVAYLRESADFNFTTDSITGNVDHLDGNALHEQGWVIVEPLFSAEREQAVEKFNALAGTDQVTTDRNKIIQAAYFGAVDTLFLTGDEALWGVFDNATGAVNVHAFRTDDSIDLIDAAVVKTVENGGKVYIAAPHFGATLRYTVEALAV